MMKRILTSALLLLFVLPAVAQEGQIALEDIWLKYGYYPQFPSEFRWMNDDQFYSVLEKEKISRYKVEDEKKVDDILDLSKVELNGLAKTSEITSYAFNDDESKILLKANSESIYRRSSKEVCFVYDTKNEKTYAIHKGEKIGNATFSPDGSKLAYTFDNNIYIYDFATQKETAVTSDGKYNNIINGSTDWVYEEEFEFVRAFDWSADSKKVAYYKSDESKVKEFVMAMYGDLYPEQYKFKYPKAGEDNSVISIHIYHLDKKQTVGADIGKETDIYIPRMKWTNDANKLALMRMNRLQNELDVLIVDATTGKSETILQEKNDTYIEVSDDKWMFLEKADEFLWTSEMEGYNHVYRYGMDGKLKNAVTKGAFEVTGLLGVDEEEELVYYMSTEIDHKERHLYSVRLDGKKKKHLTKDRGTHEIEFSSAYTFFVDTYSTSSHPGKTILRKADGKTVKTLVSNDKLAQKLDGLDIKTPEFFTFKTSENVELEGWMIKPPDFNENTKHPVLMFVYGGPGSQTVMYEWGFFNYMWFQMLAQAGYIVVSVDGRGTGGRGEAFKKSTYADLGNLETVDQIETAKWLQEQEYVDKDRIGIWGWSFGGYLTSLCLVKGEGIFKTGIAVAPVTNWRFYDTIYTERYLKTPQLNASGYDDNSPINFAKDLEGNYLLIHGTADDNVHYQNSMEWVNALVGANKQFDSFFYPNKNHGIYGGYTRYHLYKKMTDFLMENL